MTVFQKSGNSCEQKCCTATKLIGAYLITADYPL